MVYKVGLLSTHGTGKTTLAYDITAELKKHDLTVRVLGEVATIARERSIPIDKRTTLEAQAWILMRQCAAEMEAQVYDYDVAICDRTVFDNYCYMKNAVGENEHYLNFVLGHHQVHPYGHLFYLPITEELNPKKRDPDPEFQQKIKILITDFMKKRLSEEKYTFLPPNRQEWLNIIVKKTVEDINQFEKLVR